LKNPELEFRISVGFGKDFLCLLYLQDFKNLEGLKIYNVISIPQRDLNGALFVSREKCGGTKKRESFGKLRIKFRRKSYPNIFKTVCF
jgi:hypothetical protein